jgi:hypothetical protein
MPVEGVVLVSRTIIKSKWLCVKSAFESRFAKRNFEARNTNAAGCDLAGQVAAHRDDLSRDQGLGHGWAAALEDIAEALRDPVARYLKIENLHEVGKPPPWLLTPMAA